MSTSDSIVSSQTKQSSWRKSDTTWTLGKVRISGEILLG